MTAPEMECDKQLEFVIKYRTVVANKVIDKKKQLNNYWYSHETQKKEFSLQLTSLVIWYKRRWLWMWIAHFLWHLLVRFHRQYFVCYGCFSC